MRLGFAGSLLLLSCFGAGEAHADASSWFFLGGGAAQHTHPSGSKTMPGLMQLDLGLGSSPQNAIVLGGLVRSSTYFGEGTDLALLARGATQGFAEGRWGLALDVGAAQRFWGPDTAALAVSLEAGAPWGLVFGIDGTFAPDSVMTLGLVVGVDWARLTVHRRSGGSWWPSHPLPLGEDRATALR